MDFKAILMGLAFAVMWSSAFTSTRVIVTAAPPLTKEDVRRMSQEDINRNWSSVCSVLSKGD